jgi:hypothetical protein
MTPDSLQPAQDVIETLRSLPWAAHALAAFALVTGFLLWLHGRRLLKPMIVVVFLLTGAAVGFIALPLTPFAGSVSANVGLVIGATVGAILGLLLYRFAMAVSLGLVLAVIAPVLCVVITDATDAPTSESTHLTKDEMLLRGVPEESEEDRQARSIARELADRGQTLRDSVKEAAARAADPTTTTPTDGSAATPATPSDQLIRTATERVRAFALALRDDVSAQWSDLPSRVRVMLLGSASLGLGIGVVLGLLLPKWTSGAVTAMLGAAIWLPAGVWLLTAADVSIVDRFHPRPTHWLIVWGVASAVGALLQWRGLMAKRKQHPKVVVVQTK